MSERESEQPGPETPPAPSPLGALLLTAFAWSVFVLVTQLATPPSGGSLGLALGLLLGFGGAGTLAARAVPEPTGQRLGLTGFAPRLLLPVALLVPVVLLLSELDNVTVSLLFEERKDPSPDENPLPTALHTLEWVLFGVLLRPVLEEFFFRGVVQQGVIATLGRAGGALYTAALFALVRTSFFLGDAQHATSFGVQAFALGALLGALRLASGSILPGILLVMALEAVGLASLQLREILPIPGFNGGGDHTPFVWLAPAAASVAFALAWLVREARRR